MQTLGKIGQLIWRKATIKDAASNLAGVLIFFSGVTAAASQYWQLGPDWLKVAGFAGVLGGLINSYATGKTPDLSQSQR